MTKKTTIGRGLVRLAVVTSVGVVLTQPPGAVAAEEGYHKLQPTGVQDTLHFDWKEHSFGFYSGAPADKIATLLPPGFELDTCLKHRAPGATLAPGTADVVIEASSGHVYELGEDVELGVVVTCVKPPPASLGYPQPDPAQGQPWTTISDVGTKLGFERLPSAPLVFTLEMWMDNSVVVEHSRRHGLRPNLGQISIEQLPGGWRADVRDVAGGELFSAAFPRIPNGVDGKPVGCFPYKQSGHVFEWEPGDRTMGILSFTHFVKDATADPGSGRVEGSLCPSGGTYSWSPVGRFAELVGPPRPATLIGQQLEPDGVYDYFSIRKYELLPPRAD